MDTEEIFDFEGSISHQIGAVNSVDGPGVSKSSSYRVWSEVLGDLGVHWAAEVSKRLNRILLSNLKHDTWSNGHLMDHLDELWEDTLVDLEEFFGGWLV